MQKLRYAGYVRVSDQRQLEGYGLEAQKTAIQRFVAQNDGLLVEMYVDGGISGTSTDKRDDFHRMRSDARRGLVDVLGVAPATVAAMTDDTPLFGALPELDSMAVAGLLTEMEDRLEIMIDDDDIDGDLFESFGSLVAFAKAKIKE